MALKRRVIVKRDKNGTHYTIPADGPEYPKITAWWSRGERTRTKGRTQQEEYLLIRQESGERTADVILCSPGQTYDLIEALNLAVDRP